MLARFCYLETSTWKPQHGKDFAVSDGMSIFVSEKPATANKKAILLLICYPLS